MQGYSVVDLGQDGLESAYFLVRSLAPELDRDDWLSRAQALRGNGGVLGLRAPGGSLFGIMTFQKQQTLRHGPTLSVDTFAVLELARRGAGRRLLLEAARKAADRLGCTAIAYRLGEKLVVEAVHGAPAVTADRPDAGR